MSRDIIERLRHQFTGEYDPTGRLLQDAADEIERLHSLIATWIEAEAIVYDLGDAQAWEAYDAATDALRAELK